MQRVAVEKKVGYDITDECSKEEKSCRCPANAQTRAAVFTFGQERHLRHVACSNSIFIFTPFSPAPQTHSIWASNRLCVCKKCQSGQVFAPFSPR